RLEGAIRFALLVGVIGFLVIGALGFFFAPTIMWLFIQSDPEVVEIGALAMRLQSLLMPFQAVNIIISMTFQSVGQSIQASFTALSRQGLFFIPVIVIMPPLLGILGIQLSQPIADFATFIFSIALFASFWRRKEEIIGSRLRAT
ncbi:MAG: MATE family efflux transporter, partial [Sphaerochaetaceae bacterium]